MSDPAPVTYRVLYESETAAVREYCCRACAGGPAAEEHATSDDIVFLRQGAFRKHVSQRRSHLMSVNQIAFFTRNVPYRVSHPSGCGDAGTVLSLQPATLVEIIRELGLKGDDCRKSPFPSESAPCGGSLFTSHRRFARRLTDAPHADIDPLWFDVTTMELAASALTAAYAFQRQLKTPRIAVRQQLERIEAAKCWLAANLGRRVTLDDVAGAVESSKFHLARSFKHVTGLSLHRFLMKLRLRTAYHRVEQGDERLTGLALELGFSSHSHFTDAFRREFGVPPSTVRSPGTNATEE